MEVTDKITITCEDNMDLMARYPDNYFDLAIVDPPYGNIDAIGLTDNKKKNKQAAKRKGYHLFENIAPNNQYYLELERISKNQIIWGGNFLGLCGGVIVWDKNGTAFGEGEIAICSTHKSVQIFEYTWNGMLQGDMKNKEHRIHPTQKPVALYKWILDKYAKPSDKILDTHLGSGSIAIACHDYRFELTACELDPDYYNKAIERIKNHVSQLTLF
jgi:site-specific DNA-methyltransferase (adenine-specific)